jgi:hypothetical protein
MPVVKSKVGGKTNVAASKGKPAKPAAKSAPKPAVKPSKPTPPPAHIFKPGDRVFHGGTNKVYTVAACDSDTVRTREGALLGAAGLSLVPDGTTPQPVIPKPGTLAHTNGVSHHFIPDNGHVVLITTTFGGTTRVQLTRAEAEHVWKCLKKQGYKKLEA